MPSLWKWAGALLLLPSLAFGDGDVPRRYIVEFTSDRTSIDSFVADLARDGVAATRGHDLSFSLYNGGSFLLDETTKDEASVVKRIASLPAVKTISPAREVSLPKTKRSVARNLPPHHLVSRSLRRRDIPLTTNEVPHKMTGVDKARAQGFLGSGVRVAVMDSGVDYKHPALGGCFGPGCLVSFGYDLVDDDEDPYGNCDGHGTHVSGLVAAQPNPYNFTGVAPNVTMGHYRIINCNGVATTDRIMKSFQMAYDAGVDLITASVGYYSGWSEDPWAVLVNRINEAGVPCLIAAGNGGADGMFMASNGIAKHATPVGSVDNLLTPLLLTRATYSVGKNTTIKEFGWQEFTNDGESGDFVNGSYPLIPLGLDITVDGEACAPLSQKLSSTAVILIRRGGCPLDNKVKHAVDAGAKNVFIYNNELSTYEYDILPKVEGLGGVGMVPQITGEQWVKLIAAGQSVTVNMISKEFAPTYFSQDKNTKSPGFVSYFSQWGPTNELAMNPIATAPGGYMLSTWPVDLGAYAIDSGTSMATPYMAGCMALLIEARGRGKITPAEINSLLATNANPNVFHDGATAYPWIDSVTHQGGGLVQIHDSIQATTLINTTFLAFNDTLHLRPQTFTLHNTGSEIVTYSLSSVGSGTVYPLANDGSTIPQGFDEGSFMETVQKPATLSFSQSTVLLPPGQTTSIRVSAVPPAGLNATRIPIYSGYVTINGTNGDSLSIPYLGAATAMRNVTQLDTQNTDGDNTFASSATGEPFTAGTRFLLPPQDGSDTTEETSTPLFNWFLSMGTRSLRVDIKPIGNSTIAPLVAGQRVLGSHPGYPVEYTTRSVGAKTIEFTGQLDDGSFVPAGYYQILVRALKFYGDPGKAGDYEVVESPRFYVSYAEGSA